MINRGVVLLWARGGPCPLPASLQYLTQTKVKVRLGSQMLREEGSKMILEACIPLPTSKACLRPWEKV